jgi:predicted dehydrogenase
LFNVRRLLPDADITVWRHANPTAVRKVPDEADRIVYDLEQALSTRPQIAIIASPAPFHVRTALELASAGIHLLIEKPLSDSLDGVDDLIHEAESKGVVLMVGYHLRFSPSLNCIRGAITDGAIGTVLSLRAEVGQFLPDWRPGTDYRSGVSARSEMGGGVILELSHELDYVRWLGGEIRSVQAETGHLAGLEIDVEDVAEIVVRFDSGAIGSIHLDMFQRIATRTCRVVGSEGSVEWDGLRGVARLFSATTGGWADLYGPSGAELNEMYLSEVGHFIQCAQDGGEIPVDGAGGRRIVELALAIKGSAELGQRVFVESSEPQ